MFDIFLLQKVILIVVDILAGILGIVVYLSNHRNKTNLLFSMMSLTFIIWTISGFFVYYESLLAYSTLMGRISFGFVALSLITILLFVDNFPKEKRINVIEKLVLIFGLMLAFLSFFTRTIVVNVQHNSNHGVTWTMGPYEKVFYFYGIIIAILTIYKLIKIFLSSKNTEKENVKYLIYGAILVAIFNTTFNVINPLVNPQQNLYWVGDFSVIFFLGFTAYSIIKYQLFNIRVIATETTVIALSIGLLIEVFLSNSITEGALKGIVWVLATYGGWVLIKSVKMEIKQKEDLQVLSKKLDEANRHLEDLDEQKDNFISMASHELNTPIAAIEGYLSMIIDEKMAGDINPKAKAYLENIYFSSKRLAALVRDLLNVSRIESGRVHLINEEASIEDVIEKSIAEVKIKADEVGHKLTFEKPKTALPKTWFDISRVTEVMINIIGNAIKYTEPPGKITVSAHADDGKLVVAIKDNGRGIPKDKEEAIFEKFSQVEVLKDQVKGTGLGMFITKNLVELHKGKLWFKSSTDKADHGTTFYFSLPIYKTKPADPHEGEGALFQKKPTDVNAPVTTPTKPPIPKETEPRL